MMSCDEAMRLLWEYLDGAVNAVELAAVEEHLARCRRCCGERDFAKELRRFLAAQAHVDDLPKDVAHRLNQIVEDLGQ
jgi:anti-sigma factor (TIGR02949 family)